MAPLVLGLLPAATAELFEGENLHGLLLTFALAFAAMALLPGYRRHKSKGVIVLGALGAVALVLGMFAGEEHAALETGATLAGGACLTLAHARNHTLCRACCADTAATRT
ncbi:MAG: MerC domain-containing protein [Myxococcaceae bacterium]|nr:MerC domain-containing protein [Myxococcaceae bacterium]MCI0669351.1 MerC domain-containing protein [Myxococcaceae bacterium]